VAAPAYIIGRDPSLRIISVSRAADLATQFGSRVKNIVGSDEFRLATGIELSQDTRAKDNWKTTDGGGYVAVGAGGGVLGLRADVVLCDDIHASFEDAQSETQLQKIRTWFESDLLSRLTPTGKLIIVGQRLNANDIIGYVLQRAAENPAIRIRTLKFTAECDADNPADDLLGRALGERMWPEFYTDEYLADKKRDDYIWKTLWMQEPPSDTGSWVAPDELTLIDPDAPPPSLIYYLCSDLALSVNSGDYSVHIVCGMDDTRTMHVVHAWRDRCDVNATADKMIALTLQYHPVECLIDDDNASKVFVQLLASKCREQGVPVPWKALPMRGQDKETRASPLRGAFKRRKVVFHRGEWTRWLFKELLMFPNAMGQGVDDGVDALGLMGRRMASLAAAAPPLAPVIPMKTIQQATLAELWDDKDRSFGRHSRRI
jgi:predicted phage terminase large subunit-like protein